jgi:hypothetical protein
MKAIGGSFTLAYINLISYLPVDRPAKAIGLFFVFLLDLAEERPGESYCFYLSFGEGLSLDIGQPVPKNSFNANSSLPVE